MEDVISESMTARRADFHCGGWMSLEGEIWGLARRSNNDDSMGLVTLLAVGMVTQ